MPDQSHPTAERPCDRCRALGRNAETKVMWDAALAEYLCHWFWVNTPTPGVERRRRA